MSWLGGSWMLRNGVKLVSANAKSRMAIPSSSSRWGLCYIQSSSNGTHSSHARKDDNDLGN